MKEAKFESHRGSVYKEDLPANATQYNQGVQKPWNMKVPPHPKTNGGSILGGLEYQHTHSEYPDLDKTVKCYQLLDLCTLSLTGTRVGHRRSPIGSPRLPNHQFYVSQITNVGRCLFSIIKNKFVAKLGACIQH